MKRIFGIFVVLTASVFFFIQAQGSKEYRGFVYTKAIDLPDSYSKLVELEHSATGARVLHIQNDDQENFFAICFRTYPTASNGVAHVLEHSVTQGSKNYPVKNLFVHMKSRSFATFMNAITGPDFTVYPASSELKDDFYNLFSVFSDAVFHPLLKKECFLQEGIRLEFEEYDDPQTPLQYKGVVYNEMKGKLASSHVRMLRAMNEELFPDNGGRIFSGGDPEEIRELSYDELLQFHKEHYYPGNCLFFFYGNLPLEGHLDFLAEHVLADLSEKKEALPPRPRQPVLSAPKSREMRFPAANDSDALISIGWLTSDQEESLALHLLDHIMMGSDAAPLKHELLQLRLAKEIDSFIDPTKAQVPYTLYFEGCNCEDAKKIEEHVLAALASLADRGIDEALFERTLAQIELVERERNVGSSPRGYSLLFTAAVDALHGRAPEKSLTLSDQIRDLRKRVKQDPSYFSHLIRKYFLDNPHRVLLSLTPSIEKADEEMSEERQKLNSINESFDKIIANSKALREWQNSATDEQVACLPTVTLDSVSKEAKRIPLSKTVYDNIEVYHHQAFTNKITFASLEFALPEMPQEDIWLVSLYSYLLGQLGITDVSYRDRLSYIQEHTGGIGSEVVIRYGTQGSYPALKIAGKALSEKAEILLNCFYEMLTAADFSDRERIKQLLAKHASEIDLALNNSALELACMKALSRHSAENDLINNLEGLNYCLKVKEAMGNIEGVIDALQSLQKKMVPQRRAHLVIGGQEIPALGKLQALPIVAERALKLQPVCEDAQSFGYPIDASIAFNAQGFTTDKSNPYLLLAAEIMTSEVLCPQIREQHGAYGTEASYQPNTGNFCFWSYRDPNVKTTFQVFETSARFVAEGRFTTEALQRAKIAVFQKIDRPINPAGRASVAYQHSCEGRTDAMRDAFRNKLLNASVLDIQAAAKEHILPKVAGATKATFGSKALLENRNSG